MITQLVTFLTIDLYPDAPQITKHNLFPNSIYPCQLGQTKCQGIPRMNCWAQCFCILTANWSTGSRAFFFQGSALLFIACVLYGKYWATIQCWPCFHSPLVLCGIGLLMVTRCFSLKYALGKLRLHARHWCSRQVEFKCQLLQRGILTNDSWCLRVSRRASDLGLPWQRWLQRFLGKPSFMLPYPTVKDI